MAIGWASIIADNVIGYILDQSGVGEAIRGKLQHDSEKQALKHALIQSFEQFSHQHSEAASSLFDLDFFKHEGGSIVEQFLIRDGKPDPSDLALHWADLLNIRQTERRTMLVRELEHIAADFLSILSHHLKAEPDLKEINDSRALEQTTHYTAALSISFDTFLDTFLQRLNSNKSTPGTLLDYLHWLIERNLYLDPRGVLQTQRSVQVKLDEVYISLQAQYDATPNSVDRRLLEKDLADLEIILTSSGLPTEDLEDLREHLLDRYNNRLLIIERNKGEVLELAEVVNCHKRLVVLGDPGGGKTTLLRYLALKHAQAMQAGNSDVDPDLGATLFPISVRIADYAEYGLPKGKSLSDFLIDYCSMHECPDEGLADLLSTKLVDGKCLILLDGLDEIVSADERRNVVRQVEEFVRRYDDKANRFIITSRIAGYRSASLGEPFAHYTVQEMDENQIRRFLERWCGAVETSQTPDLAIEVRESAAKREIEGIMRAVQNSRGVHRLAANPLLLRILALIHRTGAQLPQKRIELYRLTAETLARTWRMSQGISESALVKDEYLTPLLSKLAYWLHVNKPTGIATEREVYDVLGEEWASLHDIEWNSEKPNPKIREDVKNFLLAVREHTGLFVERAPKRYGFMHLTFEEYYTARYLVSRSRTRARLLREHLHDPHWNEPILLALGFVGMESSLESNELLETAILARGRDALYFGFTPSLYEDFLGRDYLFALRCLSDGTPVSPMLRQRLLKRLVDELLFQTGSARFWRYRQALYERLEALNLSESASVLSALILDVSRGARAETRYRAVECLKRLGQPVPDEISDPITVIDVDKINTTLVSEKVSDNSKQDTTSQLDEILRLGRAARNSPEEIHFLLNTLGQSNDPGLREATVWSLGRLNQTLPEVIEALIGALQDVDARVRYTSALSLGALRLASPVVVTALYGALQDIDARVRQEAITSLAKLDLSQSEVVTTLHNLMHQDADTTVCYVAAVSLGKLKHMSSDVVATLLLALNNALSRSIRQNAALLLGEVDQLDDTIIVSLQQGLLDEDSDVRTSCVEALVQLGHHFPDTATSIGSKLVQAIEDPNFIEPDNKKGRSAQEYAFNGLWRMVVSGEVVREEY